MKTTYYKLNDTFSYPLRKISGNIMYYWRLGKWESYGAESPAVEWTNGAVPVAIFYRKYEITEAEAFRYILEN